MPNDKPVPFRERIKTDSGFRKAINDQSERLGLRRRYTELGELVMVEAPKVEEEKDDVD